MNKEGAIEYPTNLWNKISENAQDLVKKMLEKNPDDRISAEEALNHNWFTNQDMSQSWMLDDVIDGLNEQHNIKIDLNVDSGDNPLLMLTPVMNGNLVSDNPWESPFYPVGKSPIGVGWATPVLQHGFIGGRNNKVIDLFSMTKAHHEEDKTEHHDNQTSPENFKGIANKDRKMRAPKMTSNFGNNFINDVKRFDKVTLNSNKKLENKEIEEIKSIIKPVFQKEPSEPTAWDIKEDDLAEHPEGMPTSRVAAWFKSFKPGKNSNDRLIPPSIAEKKESMSNKNKPYKPKI